MKFVVDLFKTIRLESTVAWGRPYVSNVRGSLCQLTKRLLLQKQRTAKSSSQSTALLASFKCTADANTKWTLLLFSFKRIYCKEAMTASAQDSHKQKKSRQTNNQSIIQATRLCSPYSECYTASREHREEISLIVWLRCSSTPVDS